MKVSVHAQGFPVPSIRGFCLVLCLFASRSWSLVFGFPSRCVFPRVVSIAWLVAPLPPRDHQHSVSPFQSASLFPIECSAPLYIRLALFEFCSECLLLFCYRSLMLFYCYRYLKRSLLSTRDLRYEWRDDEQVKLMWICPRKVTSCMQIWEWIVWIVIKQSICQSVFLTIVLSAVIIWLGIIIVGASSTYNQRTIWRDMFVL